LSMFIIVLVVNLGMCLVHAHSEQNHILERQRLRSASNRNMRNKILSMLSKQQSSRAGTTSQQNPRLEYSNPSTVEVTERIQSFFPECGMDDYYERQLPQDSAETSYLIYNLKFPNPPSGSSLRVADARLRIFMPPSPELKAGADTAVDLTKPVETENCSSEERYRITVSWIQLRNHHSFVGESVMLDTTMVDQSYTGWLSFNVIGAARNWYRHKHRPAAIAIQIEDMKRRPVKASEILQTMNCSSTVAGSSSGQQDQQAQMSMVPQGQEARLIMVSQHYPLARGIKQPPAASRGVCVLY